MVKVGWVVVKIGWVLVGPTTTDQCRQTQIILGTSMLHVHVSELSEHDTFLVITFCINSLSAVRVFCFWIHGLSFALGPVAISRSHRHSILLYHQQTLHTVMQSTHRTMLCSVHTCTCSCAFVIRACVRTWLLLCMALVLVSSGSPTSSQISQWLQLFYLGY